MNYIIAITACHHFNQIIPPPQLVHPLYNVLYWFHIFMMVLMKNEHVLHMCAKIRLKLLSSKFITISTTRSITEMHVFTKHDPSWWFK